jgi:hypothetical protein
VVGPDSLLQKDRYEVACIFKQNATLFYSGLNVNFKNNVAMELTELTYHL